MRAFEKDLKVIQDKFVNSDIDFLCSEKMSFSTFTLKDLQARNLIILTPAGDDTFFITLGEKGYSYFDDKSEKRADFIKSFFSNFLAGVLSGAGATLLVEHVIFPFLSK